MRHLGATAALASGILGALATASLVMFAISGGSPSAAPGATGASGFVRLSDAFSGIGMLVAVPVAFRLHRSWRARAPRPSGVALLIGMASLVGYATVVLSYAAGLDDPAVQGPLTVAGLGGIGLWILLASVDRADAALEGSLRWIGGATGFGNMALAVAYFLAGASSATGSQLVPASPALLLAYAAGVISSDLGYPIWAIWLGRRLRYTRHLPAMEDVPTFRPTLPREGNAGRW